MGDSGWIKLHRKIENNWIWEDPEKLKAWLDILLMVNHEDRQIILNGQPVMIRAGQRFTSLAKLSKRWGWSKAKTNRFLHALSETQMVTVSGTPSGTLLTVEKWAFYQGERNTTRNTERNANEAQTRMNKKYKKKEEVYRASAQFVPPTVEEITAYCRERKNQVDPEGFFDYYEARGWKLSKGAPMKDWRATVRGWEKRQEPAKKYDNHPDQRKFYGELDKEIFGDEWG